MTDSNKTLERRYRRLLRLYPRSYQHQHAEDMLGVLMSGANSGQSRPRPSETFDLVRGALFIQMRYWWQMRLATEHDSLAVRHPDFVIRVRIGVSLWLCFLAVILFVTGLYWWGAAMIFFVGLHLLFIRRTMLRQRRG
jgi:hypothetical protein